jgi:FkbM family methyltransferase
MLRASASRYPHLSITQLALSDHEGEGEVHSPRDLALASLREMPIQARAERCRLSTLDNFLQQVGSTAPTFVKCDVEGAELEVLRGASKVLTADKPAMWMLEINPLTCQRFGHNPESLVEFFSGCPIKGTTHTGSVQSAEKFCPCPSVSIRLSMPSLYQTGSSIE